MSVPINSECHGKASVSDNDLLTMLTHFKSLPWMQDVLEEIQWHRSASDDIENDRVDYLEGVLNDIGASYDPSEDGT